MKMLNDFPEYKAAAERFAELQTKLSAAEKQAAAIQEKIAHANTTTRGDALTVRAKGMLTGDTTALVDVSVSNLQNDLIKVRDEAALLRRAVELQRKIVDTARYAASRRICEEVAPEHKKLAREIAQAAAELARVNGKLRDFMGDLEAGGVAISTLPGALYPRTGFWSDPDAGVHFYLKEMREAGIIGKDELVAPEPKPEVPPNGYEALSAGPDGIKVVQFRNGKPEPVKILYDPKKKVGWG